MGFWLRWGGVLLGAISFFSLAHKVTDFGLAPIFKDMLNFYKAVLYPVAELILAGLRWLLSLINAKLPTIPPDGVVIYLLLGSAFFRYIHSYAYNFHSQFTLSAGSYYRTLSFAILYSLVWPITLVIGLIISFEYWIRVGILEDALIPDPYGGFFVSISSWLIEIIKVLIAFVLLFATNAYFSP